MRLEIKIPYNTNSLVKIQKNLNSIKNLKKQYPSRRINSIYYDNLDNQIARDNLSGISRRCKLRVRYYGNEKTSNCFLEIKKKLNKFGFKKVIDMQKKISDLKFDEVFKLNNNLHKKIIRDDYAKDYILNDYLSPQVEVSYIRDYYISNKIRLTHDKEIIFKPCNIENKSTMNIAKDYLNVLEIKFDYNNIADVNEIINKIDIKPKRFSKYLRGLSFFNKSIYL
jgi:hypothetical protein|tara:strand:+ start:482 stop:1153 length:672 start_codon:yes stop_codon:yes gene_type:complete